MTDSNRLTLVINWGLNINIAWSWTFIQKLRLFEGTPMHQIFYICPYWEVLLAIAHWFDLMRNLSIYNTYIMLFIFLLACPADGVIIIHDAVRPFVEENILKSVAISAQNFGVNIPNKGIDWMNFFWCFKFNRLEYLLNNFWLIDWLIDWSIHYCSFSAAKAL